MPCLVFDNVYLLSRCHTRGFNFSFWSGHPIDAENCGNINSAYVPSHDSDNEIDVYDDVAQPIASAGVNDNTQKYGNNKTNILVNQEED